ncbi:acyl-CoA thioesterase [Marinobacterium sediminicola]|uniref:Acyl-CoA thioesterase FadM n=1 Tax=Marinobacterium sediminicola TaxID=518898 RepID=A0ABY1S046_9GAMM|nr:thioesterase family protein [Marinobacterium sediminicola]ULG69990.1 thioesterase family protein [Marinobacterium sediminicola]SMR74443.1 Acyl-CoA thioesterase FadM [Marinobacterium sediminicola]
MARIKLNMPDNYLFSTELAVRISDINYGGHMGNDAVLSMVHEARLRFLKHYHYTEFDVEGAGIIMTDSAIVYKNEGFHGDRIQVDVTVADFNKYGCDLYYLLSNKDTAVEVAHAKTGIVFFDYDNRKVVTVPEGFRNKMLREP